MLNTSGTVLNNGYSAFKMMKRCICIFLSLMCMLGLLGCSADSQIPGVNKKINHASVSWYGDTSANKMGVTVDFESGKVEMWKEDGNHEEINDVSQEVMDEFQELFASYLPVVKSGESRYSGHNGESPAMLQMFAFRLEYSNGSDYFAESSLTYPDGWDEFLQNLSDLCSKISS